MTTKSSKVVEFDYKGEHFKVEYRVDEPKWYGRDKDPKHMRLYAWLPDSLDVEKTELEKLAKSLGLDSIYTSIGDHPEMDKAWREYNRLEVRAMTMLAHAALDALNDENLTAYYNPSWMKYSKTAGCSCGCSPGFIVNDRPGNETIYINRYNAEEEEKRKVSQLKQAQERLSASRAQVHEDMEVVLANVQNLTQKDCDELIALMKKIAER